MGVIKIWGAIFYVLNYRLVGKHIPTLLKFAGQYRRRCIIGNIQSPTRRKLTKKWPHYRLKTGAARRVAVSIGIVFRSSIWSSRPIKWSINGNTHASYEDLETIFTYPIIALWKRIPTLLKPPARYTISPHDCAGNVAVQITAA